MDFIAPKRPFDLISLQEINFHLQKRLSRKEIVVRNLPQLESVNPLEAVTDYLLLLEKFGIIVRKGETIYQLKKAISIPQSNREREEAKMVFFQKYHQI
jgi:CRISPR/Cas system-associated exonuclease Cas4 (RecB family)